MKYKIVNPQSSLDKVIFGVESNLERRNYDAIIEQISKNPDVVVEVSKNLIYPEIYRDDILVYEGSFPNMQDLKNIFGTIIVDNIEQTSSLLEASNDKRVGICCGVGGDIYLDPYENN